MISLTSSGVRIGRPLELVAALERRLAERRLDSPLIFHNGQGRHVGNFSTSWGRALGRARVTFAFHDLRRTAVRDMSRAGGPERVIMEITGHRTRATFDRYNIVSGNDLDDAFAKRAAHEAQMSKASSKANFSKEPVAFPSPAPSPHRSPKEARSGRERDDERPIIPANVSLTAGSPVGPARSSARERWRSTGRRRRALSRLPLGRFPASPKEHFRFR
jgi:hypothetical protein